MDIPAVQVGVHVMGKGDFLAEKRAPRVLKKYRDLGLRPEPPSLVLACFIFCHLLYLSKE